MEGILSLIVGFVKRNRRMLALVLLVVALERKYRIRAHLAEQSRRAEILRKLPGPKLGSDYEHPVFGHFGSTKVMLRPGEKFDPDFISTVTASRFRELCMKQKNETDMIRVYGLNSRFPTNQGALIIVFGMDSVREVLSHKGMDDFHKGLFYRVSEVLIGKSVLHAHGPVWQRQRAAMEKGMTHAVMEAALPRVLETVNELCGKLEKISKASNNTAEIDMSVESLKLTLDVIGRAAFSHNFGSVLAKTTADAPLYDPFQIILKTLNNRCQEIYKHLFSFLPTSENRKFDTAIGKLKHHCAEIIEGRTAPKGDLLDILMENRDTPQGLPTNLIRDNVHTMLFAGHDTTGAALTWMVRLLAEHPQYMKLVQDEIISKFGANGDPTYQDLEELNWLNAVVLETLRLYPSAAFTRENDHDVYLQNGKYTIPAGSQLIIVPYIIHRDERYWERPDDFYPDRFLNEEIDLQAKDKRGNSLQSRIARIGAKKAYLPFSLGPRNCVGRPLALMEMRVVLVKLLQKFSFQLPKDDSNFNRVPLFQLTLNPSDVRLVPVLRA